MKMARDPSVNHRLSVATFSLKRSWLFAFLSMLLTIALFLPIEAINNKTDDEDVKLSQGRKPVRLNFNTSVNLSSELTQNSSSWENDENGYLGA